MNPDSFTNPNNFFSTVQLLVGGEITGPINGPISEYTFHEDQTPPTEKEIEDKLQELQADYDAKKYQRDRIYPPIGDQLDQIFWEGIDEWKKVIKAVKDAHPKPE